jgi:CBS domain containing-hemolysin-like protein
MDADIIDWTGLAVSFLLAFLLSLFHVALSTSSKISIQRYLESREKSYRQKIMEVYAELQTAVEILRVVFILAFVVYLYNLLPRLRLWPLWLFLVSISVYILLLDFLPRLITTFNRKGVLIFFLPSFRLISWLGKPEAFLSRIHTSDKEPEEQREATDDEIQALIDEAEEEGIIEGAEGELLQSVVEFGDTIVREIMTPRVTMDCISRDSDILTLRNLVIRVKHSRIPVYKDRIDNIEGVIMAKDLLEYSEDKNRNDTIEPLMREPYFVPESMKVAELLKELQDRKQKMAIVVDEHGGVSGLVTMEDLMEEIVGEIQDEYDLDSEPFEKKAPGDYVVQGDTDVEELEDLFDVDLVHDDYITVGGLVTHKLGRFPISGEHLLIEGLDFEILEVDQKRILSIRVKRPEINKGTQRDD